MSPVDSDCEKCSLTKGWTTTGRAGGRRFEWRLRRGGRRINERTAVAVAKGAVVADLGGEKNVGNFPALIGHYFLNIGRPQITGGAYFGGRLRHSSLNCVFCEFGQSGVGIQTKHAPFETDFRRCYDLGLG